MQIGGNWLSKNIKYMYMLSSHFFILPGICNENQYKCDDGAGCYSKVTCIWLLVFGIIHDVSSST